MLPHSHTLFLFRANRSLFFLLNATWGTNPNFIIIALTRSGREPTIYVPEVSTLTITPPMQILGMYEPVFP
jgi:hypothetical protein